MRLQTTIAGASFAEEGAAIVTALKMGQRYRLVPEPQNAFDKHAVGVWVDDFVFGRRAPKAYRIGYIPQKWSKTVAAALSRNHLHVWALKPDEMWGTIEVKWVDVTADPL